MLDTFVLRTEFSHFKGTVSPALSRPKVVWLNVVESEEGPQVVFRFYFRQFII
jgi:hypothetical protein